MEEKLSRTASQSEASNDEQEPKQQRHSSPSFSSSQLTSKASSEAGSTQMILQLIEELIVVNQPNNTKGSIALADFMTRSKYMTSSRPHEQAKLASLERFLKLLSQSTDTPFHRKDQWASSITEGNSFPVHLPPWVDVGEEYTERFEEYRASQHQKEKPI